MLLLRYLQLSSRFGWSLANLVALLRMNLFTHRDLMAWLDKPFGTPPNPQHDPQAAFAFAQVLDSSRRHLLENPPNSRRSWTAVDIA